MYPVIVDLTKGSKPKANVRYSDPFTLMSKGTRCICMYIVMVMLTALTCQFMKGPHDELTWPLRGKFVMKLLNQLQISDCEHYSRTMIYTDCTPDSAASRATDSQIDFRVIPTKQALSDKKALKTIMEEILCCEFKHSC